MFKHILLPTDGSELSKKAINGGLEFAKTVDARVTAYICLEDYLHTTFRQGAVENPQAVKERIENYAKLYLKEVEDMAKSAGVAFDMDMTTYSEPYLGIIDAAKRHGCDVIFMASHGRGGIAGLLLGSETLKVLTHTDIPVLVYR